MGELKRLNIDDSGYTDTGSNTPLKTAKVVNLLFLHIHSCLSISPRLFFESFFTLPCILLALSSAELHAVICISVCSASAWCLSSSCLVSVHLHAWYLCSSSCLVSVHLHTWCLFIFTPGVCSSSCLVSVHLHAWYRLFIFKPGVCSSSCLVSVHLHAWYHLFIFMPGVCSSPCLVSLCSSSCQVSVHLHAWCQHTKDCSGALMQMFNGTILNQTHGRCNSVELWFRCLVEASWNKLMEGIILFKTDWINYDYKCVWSSGLSFDLVSVHSSLSVLWIAIMVYKTSACLARCQYDCLEC